MKYFNQTILTKEASPDDSNSKKSRKKSSKESCEKSSKESCEESSKESCEESSSKKEIGK